MAIFQIPTNTSLKEAFSSLSERARDYIRNGFKTFATLSDDKRSQVLGAVTNTFQSDYAMESSTLAHKIGISEDETTPLLVAAGTLAGVISSRKESPEEFVAAAVDAKVIDMDCRESVLAFANEVFASKRTIKTSLDRAMIGSRVLPSLELFDIAVEIRFDFEGETIKEAVPIAVVHLDTDSYDQEAWFQLGRQQIERLVENLQKTLRQMDQAEGWASNHTSRAPD